MHKHVLAIGIVMGLFAAGSPARASSISVLELTEGKIDLDVSASAEADGSEGTQATQIQQMFGPQHLPASRTWDAQTSVWGWEPGDEASASAAADFSVWSSDAALHASGSFAGEAEGVGAGSAMAHSAYDLTLAFGLSEQRDVALTGWLDFGEVGEGAIGLFDVSGEAPDLLLFADADGAFDLLATDLAAGEYELRGSFLFNSGWVSDGLAQYGGGYEVSVTAQAVPAPGGVLTALPGLLLVAARQWRRRRPERETTAHTPAA